MKCKISQCEITTTGSRKDLKYNLRILIIAETPEEGMELGFTATRLIKENICTIVHQEKATIELEIWGNKDSAQKD